MSLDLNNLENILNRADENTIEKGYNWYLEAHRELWELCITYNQPIPKVSAICSKLSPGIRWETNIIATEKVLIATENEVPMAYGYRANVLKSLDILKGLYGTDFDEVANAFSKRSRKTLNFYGNLCYPLSNDYVTIDRWIYRSVTSLDIDLKYINLNTYNLIADAIKVLAEKKKLIPNQVQAVIWEQIKLESNTKYASAA